MRLTCEVKLTNRMIPTLGITKNGKPARCQIALGRKPASIDKTVYLMVSTSQNPSGTMFKVRTLAHHATAGDAPCLSKI